MKALLPALTNVAPTNGEQTAMAQGAEAGQLSLFESLFVGVAGPIVSQAASDLPQGVHAKPSPVGQNNGQPILPGTTPPLPAAPEGALRQPRVTAPGTVSTAPLALAEPQGEAQPQSDGIPKGTTAPATATLETARQPGDASPLPVRPGVEKTVRDIPSEKSPLLAKPKTGGADLERTPSAPSPIAAAPERASSSRQAAQSAPRPAIENVVRILNKKSASQEPAVQHTAGASLKVQTAGAAAPADVPTPDGRSPVISQEQGTAPTARTANPSQQTPAPAGPEPAAVAQVRTAIQARGTAGTIEVQLDPPELGRVQIELEFQRQGQVRAVISAAEPETLDALRRHGMSLAMDLEHGGFDDVELAWGDSGQGEPETYAQTKQPNAVTTSAEDAPQYTVPSHDGALNLQL